MTSPASRTDLVADDIRGQIYSGALKPGEKLPAEPVLMDRYQVSRTTVRRALGQLIHEGLLISRMGVGYSVRASTPLVWEASRAERNVRTDISPADAWSQGVREQGREPREEIEVAITAAPAGIAELLEIDPGDPVVVRRRIRYVDGDVMLTADTYFPEKIVRDTRITHPGDVLPGTYAVMESRGYGWVRSLDDVVVRMPTRGEVLRLGLAPGTPVAEHTRTSWSADGTPVRVQVSVLPGDRVKLRYQIEERETE